MGVIQNTTDIPNKRLREIIEFVRPNNLPTSNFDVRLTYTKHSSNGICYTDGYNDPERPHIILRIPRYESGFPYYEDCNPKVRRPYRRVVLYFEKFNEKTKQYQTWRYHKWYTSIKDKEKQMPAGGYLSSLILSREEALVHITAHELRHLWQSNHPGKRGRVWGARGQYSERDADAYAIRMVRLWRKLHAPREIYPEDNGLFSIPKIIELIQRVS